MLGTNTQQNYQHLYCAFSPVPCFSRPRARTPENSQNPMSITEISACKTGDAFKLHYVFLVCSCGS